VNCVAGDLRIERGGFGAWTRRVREDVEIGERKRIDEAESGFVIGFGFAGEASDDVGTDGGGRKKFANEFYAAGVVLRAIPTVHGGEDIVRAGLKGHVEMVGDAAGACEERDEILGDVERLNGTDAKTRKRGFIEDSSQEIEKVRARRKIAAPCAEIDAAEDDFAEAGIGKAADFGENGFGRKAAAFAANERNDAERATIVAAVLNFEGGASVIPFSAEDGSDEDVIRREDVSDQKGGRRGRGGFRG